MPDQSVRWRMWLGIGICVSLLFAGGSFFAGWQQTSQTNQRLAQHVREHCVDDVRGANERHRLDEALLAADLAKLHADLAARSLPGGTPQSRALLAADIAFARAVSKARAYDLAHTPVEHIADCYTLPR